MEQQLAALLGSADDPAGDCPGYGIRCPRAYILPVCENAHIAAAAGVKPGFQCIAIKYGGHLLACDFAVRIKLSSANAVDDTALRSPCDRLSIPV